MKLLRSIIGLIKWLVGAALFLVVFLLCLIFVPGIFDEIIIAIIAVAAAIANPPSIEGD